MYVVAGGRRRRRAKDRELKSPGMPVLLVAASLSAEFAGDFPMRSPSVMKPRNGLASRFAIMAQRKNRRLPRSYANPVMNEGSYAKTPVLLSPAVIGSRINSLATASRMHNGGKNMHGKEVASTVSIH